MWHSPSHESHSNICGSRKKTCILLKTGYNFQHLQYTAHPIIILPPPSFSLPPSLPPLTSLSTHLLQHEVKSWHTWAHNNRFGDLVCVHMQWQDPIPVEGPIHLQFDDIDICAQNFCLSSPQRAQRRECIFRYTQTNTFNPSIQSHSETRIPAKNQGCMFYISVIPSHLQYHNTPVVKFPQFAH